jgi:Ca-activated chloride channel family protein
MKTPRSLVLAALALLLAAAPSVLADGFIIIDRPIIIDPGPPPHWPGPPRPPRPIHQYFPLEVREHHVEIAIEGQVAVTSVDQTFYNPSGQRLEGTYIFPIPKGAAIDKFEMDINGELIEAELLDAKKARGIYEDIVRRAQDPALMEYAGQGLFKVRIFPIEPRAEKRIKLKYTQVLEKDGRIVEYVYPLNTEKFSSRPIGSVALKAEIRSENIIKSVYSPSHDIDLKRKGDHKVTVGFEEQNTRPDTDFKLFFALDSEDGEPIEMEMLTYRDKHAGKGEDGDGYFMLMVTPSGRKAENRVMPKDVIFVVDTSGSMRVKKLDQAKAALDFCLDSLNPEDRFEIIRYSTEAEGLFEEIVPADKKHVSEARDFVKNMRAGGGTAIEEALLMAVERAKNRRIAGAARPFQVIFMTDGRPTIGETRPEKILERFNEKRKEIDGGARVFCFGIGTDINTKLLDGIAESSRAATEYVLPEEDIEHKVSRFYEKISLPVLTALRLRSEGDVRLSKRYPGELPDLFKGDQLLVLGRYAQRGKDGGKRARVLLEGSINGEKRTFRYDADFSGKDSDHGFIPRLWATRRVGYLLDEIRLRGETSELKEEVVALARRYGIVTPYTSYLIVEDEAVRELPRTRQTLPAHPAPMFRGATRSESDAAGDFGDGFGAGGTGRGGDPSSAPAEFAEKRRNATAYDGLSKEESGDRSVAAARSTQRLKEAKFFSDVTKADSEAQYGLEGAAAVQATQAFAGKTFYQAADGWVDAEIAEHPNEEVVKIAFGSEAWFALVGQSAEISQWLSISPSMRVRIDGKIYEITAPSNP